MWQERPALHGKRLIAPAVLTVRPSAAALVFLERLLSVLGVILLGWFALAQLQMVYDQTVAARQFEETRIAVPKPVEARGSGRRLSLATGAVVGRVEIPRVGVSALVREGDDTKTLRGAVGHVPGTAFPGDQGNAALAGHRDTFFRGLKDIRKGDHILLSTPAGDARYVVRSTSVVEPTDVSVLAPTPESTLTLVTCYPFNYIGAAPRRFIVRAEIAH